jgi:hypothetical protein
MALARLENCSSQKSVDVQDVVLTEQVDLPKTVTLLSLIAWSTSSLTEVDMVACSVEYEEPSLTGLQGV